MSLTKEQTIEARRILVALFGAEMAESNPKLATVEILSKALKEMAKCDKSIAKLLDSISLSNGASWATKLLKAGLNLLKMIRMHSRCAALESKICINHLLLSV